VPLATVSSSSRPGVRRWTCGSTNSRREDEAVGLDDAVLVRVDPLRDLDDRPAVDPHLEPRVNSLCRIEHPGSADNEVRAR